MVMPAARAEWTAEMPDALPDDGQRYELIDGELMDQSFELSIPELFDEAFS